MKLGYARVSTRDQSLLMQTTALKEIGCEKIFTEKVSGAKSERKELSKLLEIIRKGDTVIVWKLDRLARSMKHLIELVNHFENNGVTFISIKDNINTESAIGRFTFHLFGAIAEFERDMIRERTIAGLRAAKKKGRVGGRPRGITNPKAANLAVKLYKSEEYSVADMLKMTGLSRSTFYKYLKQKGVLITRQDGVKAN